MNLFARNPKRFWYPSSFAAAMLLLACTLSSSNAQEPTELLREVQREFTDTIRPMLETHCGDCHWGDQSDADLNLESYETIDQLLAGRKKWKKVLNRVAAKEMPPPEDYDPIPDDDHATILAWVEQLLTSVDCTNINPGRVTVRRLNRTEYENTIGDLTGVKYKTGGNFPADDVGYGFDNIADVLSLSPILMEKYLKAADPRYRETKKHLLLKASMTNPKAPSPTTDWRSTLSSLPSRN